jgi:rod shape determining protein RodA
MSPTRLPALNFVLALFRPLDAFLLVVLGLLFGYSYVLMISASPERLASLELHMLIALTTLWATALIPLRRLLQLALPLYLFGMVLLLGVFFFGDVSKGAKRWLDLGFIRIQPSELMKIAVPLVLAWYFQRYEHAISTRHFIGASILLTLPLALIIVQPDLGTTLLVGGVGFYVLFFAGLSWKLIAPVFILGTGLIAAIVGFGDTLCQPELDWHVLRDYQKQRVCTLLDPTQDPLGKGFHIIQSTIAIGSGGVWGKGWQAGTQTHLSFIPERHTDFIFSVLAEEFGLVGGLVLLTLYTLLVIRGLIIAARAPTLGGRLIAGAITMIFFTYAFVNIGMVSGILPVVGVPLPIISYGGTALVTLCLGIGMLMSVERSRTASKKG